jgi:hypothetical protein
VAVVRARRLGQHVGERFDREFGSLQWNQTQIVKSFHLKEQPLA